MELEVNKQVKRKAQIPAFIKIGPLGIELFHADGQDEANSSPFAKVCERA
jgi:hypothetical protein